MLVRMALLRGLGDVGTGDGLTERSLGDDDGAEGHQLTLDELPEGLRKAADVNYYPSAVTAGVHVYRGLMNGSSSGLVGTGASFGIVQPTLFLNFIIKT